MNDNYAPPAAKVEDRSSGDGIREAMRIACWVCPFLMIGSLVAGWEWQFAAGSPGAYLTLGVSGIGLLGSAISLLYLQVRLRRTPDARSIETQMLTWLNGGATGLGLLIGLAMLAGAG